MNRKENGNNGQNQDRGRHNIIEKHMNRGRTFCPNVTKKKVDFRILSAKSTV